MRSLSSPRALSVVAFLSLFASLAYTGPARAQVAGVPTNLTTSQVDPTGVNLDVDLAWSAPASSGGSPITAYSVLHVGSDGLYFAEQVNTCCARRIRYRNNNTPVTFKVAAINASGTGPYAAVTFTPRVATPAPGTAFAPTNLTAKQVDPTGAQLGIDLAWTAPTSNGGSTITSYLVRRRTGGVFDFTWQANSCCTERVTYRLNGTPVTFEVAATNASGTGLFTTVTFTPQAQVVAPITAAPGFSVSWTADRVQYTWTAPPGTVTRYLIQRSPDPTFTTGVLDTNPGLTSPYATTLACNKYSFRIRAENTASVGPWSNVVTSDCSCPGTPSAPAVIAMTQNRLRCSDGLSLQWTAPATPASCPLTYRVDIKKNGVDATPYDTPQTSAQFPIETGVIYTWAVRARNSLGFGPPSNTYTSKCP